METTLPPVVLLGFWPDYDELFLESFVSATHEASVINLKKSYQKWKIPLIPDKLAKRFHYKKRLDEIFKNSPDNTLFLVQGNRRLLEYLNKYFPSRRFGIIMRDLQDVNSRAGKALSGLVTRKVPVFSYDPNDCQQYGYTQHRQFATKVCDTDHHVIDKDFCFIGRDKGRKHLLDSLKEKINESGYTSEFLIVEDSGKSRATISYQDYITEHLGCRCIIDINQPNQQGITLRPLEAALYNKKLITNNASVHDHDFFDPNNILIINQATDLSSLSDFMDKPYKPVSPEVLKKYHPNEVIQAIIECIGVKTTN